MFSEGIDIYYYERYYGNYDDGRLLLERCYGKC